MIKVPADLVPSKIDFLLLELYISRCLHHTETGESQCLFLYVLGHSSLTKSSKSNTFHKIHIQILSKFCFRPHQMNVKEHGYSSLYTPLIGITTSNLIHNQKYSYHRSLSAQNISFPMYLLGFSCSSINY